MINTLDDARFWNRVARKCATDTIKNMAAYDRTMARTWQLLRQFDTVMEIGCGTGTTAAKLAPGVSRLTASNISSEIIAITREKTEAQSCRDVEFRIESNGHPDDPGGVHDTVLAFNLLHLVPDRTATLAEAHRLLRPGGLFISKTPCLSEMNPLIRVALPVTRLLGKAPNVSFFAAAERATEIARAGFTVEARERQETGSKDIRIFIVAR
ncbi:MAG: class I SAM-dependent methyltransferase [Hyphomicrobiales bacterium]|nr:class I SAM-dependent methyltransferase [Hyphomicrobiales bacterium]